MPDKIISLFGCFLKAYKIDYPVLYGKQMEMQTIQFNYGGVYSIPTSIILGINNEILRVYPGAILKMYDPASYQNLVYTIERELKINNQDLE